MDKSPVGQSDLYSSRLVYGCMRIAGDGGPDARDKGKRAIHAAIDAGYALFDHADIYGDGACEELFGEVLRESPHLREQILVMSKCGIRLQGASASDAPTHYDMSREYISRSVEGSLRRLNIERLDLLLLHRADFLMHAEEVAAAFDALVSSGKVAHFGVSNFSTSQLDLLQAAIAQTILVNQVEINIHNIDAFSNGVLDQCQGKGITPQAWCPLAGVVYEAWSNSFTDDDTTRIRQELARQANYYGTDNWIVALAWLLAHPAIISPIIGSTTASRIKAAASAIDIDYSRQDWYRLLEARNGQAVP